MSMSFNKSQALLTKLENSNHVKQLLLINNIVDKYPDEETSSLAKHVISHFLKNSQSEKEIPDGWKKKIYLNKDLNTFDKRKKINQNEKYTKRTKELSVKQKRQLKLRKRNIDSVSYSDALLIHKHWCCYIENLDLHKDREAFHIQLSRCDMNGIMLKIIQAKNPSLVGVKGINILDRKFTFTVVDDKSIVRVIPKAGCVFEIFWRRSGDRKITLFGKYMCIRPDERSTRKIRLTMIPLL